MASVRQVVLDTETTGIDPAQGHRVIEIGAVEVVDRRITGAHFHEYLNPDRQSDPEAVRIHGITDAFLLDKPRFAEIAGSFLAFLGEDQLVIHNASFDLGFLNAELRRSDLPVLGNPVLDTLTEARRRHPGQKNDLNSLCRRYGVDNSQRTLHGALLDCQILADVYMAMTGGQVDMGLLPGDGSPDSGAGAPAGGNVQAARRNLRVLLADAEARAAHENYLAGMGDGALWSRQS